MRRARAVDANHQSWLAFSGFTRVDLSSLQRRRPSPVQYVIYPITGTAACCARAASGHAAATTPNSVNSRRLMGAHPKAKDRRISIAGQDRASQQKRTVHVRFGSFTTEAGKAKGRSTSASPQKRTNGKPSRHVRFVRTGSSILANYSATGRSLAHGLCPLKWRHLDWVHFSAASRAPHVRHPFASNSDTAMLVALSISE
jgi:Tfp pilus assembly protein PilV